MGGGGHRTGVRIFMKVGESIYLWTWVCSCAPTMRGLAYGDPDSASAGATEHRDDPAAHPVRRELAGVR